ncbi:MAG: isochorismate synthase [Myxococcota bacterium]|nr:isochorismate synthase [Myxococcota bacterium]
MTKAQVSMPNAVMIELRAVLESMPIEDGPVLIRWWTPVAGPPHAPPAEVYPWIRYHAPNQFNALAYGACWQTDGATLHDLSANFETIRQRVYDVGASETIGHGRPLAFGGAAFDAAKAQLGAPWSRWPRARLFIPEVLYIGVADRWYRVRCMMISERSNLRSVAEALMAKPSANTPLAKTPTSKNYGAVERRKPWRERVDHLVSTIVEGALKKVVLARAAVDPLSSTTSMDTIWQRLVNEAESSACFALALAPQQTFIGASPEILVAKQRGDFEAHALAGTIPRAKTIHRDEELAAQMLADDKLRREHGVVVEDIKHRLADVANQLKCDGPVAISLPRVQHLQTVITGRARPGKNLLDGASALHPTPALGGSPRDAAATYLRQTEALERGWYGGPIGWIDQRGEGIFRVAIRSGLLMDESAIVYAGAGVVDGSDADMEWDETALKMQTMRRALHGEDADLE